MDYRIGVNEYRQRLLQTEGEAPDEKLREFARERKKWKQMLREGLAEQTNKPTSPCSTKMCRLGDRECDKYRGCRDTCQVVDERITSMKTCPDPVG